MTARKMFEKLNFVYTETQNTIFYKKIISDEITILIKFDRDEKIFWSETQFNYSDDVGIYKISIKEFKAIQKQIEELGW